MTIYDLINGISSGEFDEQLKELYGTSERNIMKNKARYISAAENFSRLYPEDEEIRVFSVGGAFGIGGMFTSQYGGKTLGAALDADIIAIAALNNTHEIHYASEGIENFIIDLKNLSECDDEDSVPAVKDFISNLIEKNIKCDGFDIYVSSDKTSVSSISSSETAEILFDGVISSLFAPDEADASGLSGITSNPNLNHAVSALGGFVLAEKSEYKKLSFDFSGSGYSICTVSSGNVCEMYSDRISGLSDIMNSVAAKMDADTLADINKQDFFEMIPELRQKCSNHELLYAACYYEESDSLDEAVEALGYGDTETFFDSLNRMWESSAVFFKDCTASDCYDILLAAVMCRSILGGSGAVGINKGTVFAFVPDFLVGLLTSKISGSFKDLLCRTYNFRYKGLCELRKHLT